MRPNYAQDAPPATMLVGGHLYPCNTDYRVWLDALRLMRQLRDDEGAYDRIIELETIVFGGALVDEEPSEVIRAIAEFSKGYPSAPHGSQASSDQAFSFEYDLNEIIIAIRNQSGIDLSYRRTEPFHWWEFLLEFRTLAGSHYITNIMQIRTYNGKDEELLRLKRAYALPEEYTSAELAAYEAWSREFE